MGKRNRERRKYMSPEEVRIRTYIATHVTDILKQPREFIRYPFIDPGAVYDGNLWDWDSYWSVYGLLQMMKDLDENTREQVLIHAKGNIYNFFDHQLEDGYIPMMIEVGKWQEPYLNMRHKEGVRMNMHKPFLCTQICLISDYIGDYQWVKPYLENLERYFFVITVDISINVRGFMYGQMIL